MFRQRLSPILAVIAVMAMMTLPDRAWERLMDFFVKIQGRIPNGGGG